MGADLGQHFFEAAVDLKRAFWAFCFFMSPFEENYALKGRNWLIYDNCRLIMIIGQNAIKADKTQQYKLLAYICYR